MRLNILNRKVHYWGSAVVCLPILIMTCSGVLLQLKKHWNWVQPGEQQGSVTAPQIGFETILASVREVEELGVSNWDDVNRVDIRPGRGVAKVWLHNGWEVQVDLGTARVLQSEYRRSDWIESIHDGSFFLGDWSKLALFLPSGIMLLVLWATGLWMFWIAYAAKSRRKPEKPGFSRILQVPPRRLSPTGSSRPVPRVDTRNVVHVLRHRSVCAGAYGTAERVARARSGPNHACSDMPAAAYRPE